MGLNQTKHVYVDRDITPEIFNLLCLAEAVSPRLVWSLVAVGTLTVSRWVLEACRRIKAYLVPPHAAHNRVPTITWPLPPRDQRRRASDPGIRVPSKELDKEGTVDDPLALLTGLVRMLREGLRNRNGSWARWQWRN